MTFAAPLFLLAAIAGIIPVVLHMIHRRQAKDMPFPSLRFLRISAEKTRRRRRVQDLLLMLLRTAVLLLLAAGLAKPTLTSLASLLGRGGGSSAAAIVLDNSASMATIDQGHARFETALAAADQILRELADGDQAGVFIACGPTFSGQDRIERTQEGLRQILGQVRVASERADLAAKLQEARKALADCGAVNRQIYVITDQQAASWENLQKGDSAERGESGDGLEIPVIIVDCNRVPKPDVGVQGIAFNTAAPVVGVPIRASVELLNASSVEQQRRVELVIDGNKAGASPELKIPPFGRVVHEFTFTLDRGGLHRGEARLAGEDGLKLNDCRYFALQASEGIPVAIVKPRRHEVPYLEDSFYLEQAFAPARAGGAAIRATPLTADELPNESLDRYSVVYCVNLPALGDEAAARLKAFVDRGGSLVWICGDNVDPDAYNRMNQSAGGELLPAPLLARREVKPHGDRDAWHIAFLEKRHPALGLLAEPASLYESVLVTKHIRMDATAAGGASILARLDDGEPILIERRLRKGTVAILGTSTHVAWSNLPLRNIFLPLAAQYTAYLAGSEQKRREVIAGAPIVLPLDDDAAGADVEVLPPSGETLRLKPQEESGGGRVFRFADTHQPGITTLRVLSAQRPAQYAFAVNLDPEESLSAKVSREELQERFGHAPLLFAEDPDDLSGTFQWLREGKSLWEPLLLAVLLVLVFESFAANRFSASKEDALGKSLAAAAKPQARRRAGMFG